MTPAHRDTVAATTATDTGVGIAADNLTLIFEHFYGAPELPRRPGASGIGLTIARAHEGDIRAASRGVGHGATFTLELPLASVQSS